MSANLFRIRRLLFAGACLLLGWPSIASGQDIAPLPNCQKFEFKNNGTRDYDPALNIETSDTLLIP